jgi:LysM repeat protein
MAHHRTLARAVALTTALIVPAAVIGQAPAERPASHAVKKGDTLWDLARQYLGDPFQWPQIYQLNKDKIRDPHWIYPGQEFALPGGAVAATPAPGAAGMPARSPAEELAARRRMAMTVFNPASRRGPQLASSTTLLSRVERTAVRPGDFESSPFIWAEGGPVDGGRVDGSTEAVAKGMTLALRPIQAQEEVMLTLPRGMTSPPGTRLLTYRIADLIGGQGQVVVPTGVVQVVRFEDGNHARARLVKKFEDVFAGHGVTPLDSLAMPKNVFPTRVEFGLSTRVVWTYANPRLPGRGSFVILAAGAGQGLVTGDQVSLRVMSRGDGQGDVEVGVAQVTRVTPWGASAMMLDVSGAGIAAGTRAQVSAKMP